MNKLSILTAAAGIMVSQLAIADMGVEINPYVGIEYKQFGLKAKGQWTKLSPKNFPAGRIFVGSKFHENFGFELGYTQSKKKTKEANPTQLFGVVIPGGANLTTNLKVKIQSFDFDFNGYMPIDDNFDLIGTAGFSFMKPKVDGSATTQVLGVVVDDRVIEAKGKNRLVPRLGAGVQYNIENFGIRARVLWENTSQLKFKNLDDKPFKNSISFTLGATYSFM